MTIIIPGTGAMYAGDIGAGLAFLIIYFVTWLIAAANSFGGPVGILPVIVLIAAIAQCEMVVRRWNRNHGGSR